MSPAACMMRADWPPGRTARAKTLHWAVGAAHQAAAPDIDQELSASGYPVVGEARGAVG